MSAVLPEGVHGAEVRGSGEEGTLLPPERVAIAHAVVKRRREYAAARRAARMAWEPLGVPAVPLLNAPTRDPIWPEGVVGALTHCDGYAAAAVARADAVAAVGLDAEPNEPLPPGVWGTVSSPEERRALHGLDPYRLGVALDRLLFCAKEATFKAWFPLTRRWLDFHEATVRIDPAGGFEVRLLLDRRAHEDPRLWHLSGRWCHDRDVVVVAITLPIGGGGGGTTAPGHDVD
ncbi:4'-phosphopantetheinyl transferase [Nocardioides sp.]|uniref:4'-phosphopantetheinyl transferase family protein n=1 Tax=Nocardioides sp. TaxID=35761 RepID=UPI0026389B75|nr:4'-phosphopantetheinyl transferase superfamily protein [Nocardioides sp.]